MASIYRNAKGQTTIQFRPAPRVREQLYLGAVPADYATEVAWWVGRLVLCKRHGVAHDGPLAAWLAGVPAELRAALVAKGLVADSATSLSLGELCGYCIERADVRPASLQKYRDVRANLEAYFGADRPIDSIAPGDCDDFARWLAKKGRRPEGPLSATTVAKRVQQARSFFLAAVRKRWLRENPFDGVSTREVPSSDRVYYVTREITAALMRHADPELQVLIALARWGGLRVPSECYPLEWGWLNDDPEEGSLRVYSPKNHRYPDKRWRFVPLFPELREVLIEARDRAAEDARFVMRERPGDVSDTALRNRLERCCLRASLLPYPKLWQNMRSTRQTELVAAGVPVHVVCAWLNNSPKVALRHYLQVPAEFLRAANKSTREVLDGAVAANL